MRRIGAVLLATFAAGCGDDPLKPERSLRLELEAVGLPGSALAEYRIFVQDTVGIAHGEVANGETDTVRISSSAALTVQWQDARARVGDADYIYAPTDRRMVFDQSGRDTTVAALGSYTLASGGFVLTAPGVPALSAASWSVWNPDDSVLAQGNLRPGEVVRRGDIPPGSARLQLDTVLVELDGVHHAYAPPQHDVPLSIAASLDLTAIDAPYGLASAVVQLRPSGLPPGTGAPWGLITLAGNYSVGGSAVTDSVGTVELVPPGSYTMEWGEVTVAGVTYLPDPASTPATLEPSVAPYEFEATYAAAP